MSTEAAIQRGRGIVANPEFFMTFTLAAVLGIAAVVTVGISGPWGWLLTAIAVGVGVAGAFLGQGLFVGLVMAFGTLMGGVTVAIVWFMWGVDHGEPLWASLIALLTMVLPVAAIAGERVLPLFVAFIAGVWGILSIIVFVMVVFIGLD